jgi:hypothetical protein
MTAKAAGIEVTGNKEKDLGIGGVSVIPHIQDF